MIEGRRALYGTGMIDRRVFLGTGMIQAKDWMNVRNKARTHYWLLVVCTRVGRVVDGWRYVGVGGIYHVLCRRCLCSVDYLWSVMVGGRRRRSLLHHDNATAVIWRRRNMLGGNCHSSGHSGNDTDSSSRRCRIVAVSRSCNHNIAMVHVVSVVMSMVMVMAMMMMTVVTVVTVMAHIFNTLKMGKSLLPLDVRGCLIWGCVGHDGSEQHQSMVKPGMRGMVEVAMYTTLCS